MGTGHAYGPFSSTPDLLSLVFVEHPQNYSNPPGASKDTACDYLISADREVVHALANQTLEQRCVRSLLHSHTMAGLSFLLPLVLMGESIGGKQKDTQRECGFGCFVLLFLWSRITKCLPILLLPRLQASDRSVLTASLSLRQCLLQARPRKATVCGSDGWEVHATLLAIRTTALSTKETLLLQWRGGELICRGVQGPSAGKQVRKTRARLCGTKQLTRQHHHAAVAQIWAELGLPRYRDTAPPAYKTLAEGAQSCPIFTGDAQAVWPSSWHCFCGTSQGCTSAMHRPYI